MTILFLVRHAVHDLVGKALVGRAPGVPLSPEGRRQADSLREHFAGQALQRVLSSPVQRAQETAAAIATGLNLKVETDHGLTEIDCGDWTGSTFAELDRDPRWHVWNSERHRAAIPGGETMEDVKRRTAEVLDRLAEAAGPIVLVSHADTIKAAIAAVIAMPLNLHDRIVVDPASITTIEMWRPGAGRILRMNERAAP